MSTTPSSASADSTTEATARSPARQYIDAVLEQSFRHLFGPTATRSSRASTASFRSRN